MYNFVIFLLYGGKMRRIIIFTAALLSVCVFMPSLVCAGEDITLKEPQTKKGKPIMTALSERKSVREFKDKGLDLQTLSNLLWAANGVNRPDGKRTAPSAMNRQEIEVYACLKSGVYFYNAPKNILEFKDSGDCRLKNAPVTLLIVADSPADSKWAGVDAGIVSQNISLFCAGMGLATVPQGSMPKEDFMKMLKFDGTKKQILLNHPVGYEKKAEKN